MLFLNQSKYIQKKYEKFNLSHAKTMTTPLELKSNLENVNEIIQEEKHEMKKVPYKLAVGTKIYLDMTTRPDLVTSTSMVAQYNSKTRHYHWSLVKRIFMYLRRIIIDGLLYNGSEGNLEVIGYCDSNWRGDTKSSKSRTWYLFVLANATSSWNSNLQHIVVLSSTRVEYYVARAVAKEPL